MSLFFLHYILGFCIPCTVPYSGERKDEKKLLLLGSGSGCDFLSVLQCDSLCARQYLDTALDMYVWVNAGTLVSVSLTFCGSLYVCMRVEFVCSCLPLQLCVFVSCFCVFDVSDFKYASLCACLHAATECGCLCLCHVCVFLWACFHTSLTYPYWRVCNSLIALCVHFPLVWCVLAVQRQLIDSLCFFYPAWSRVAQERALEL